ncbi:MAG: hypothetical protein AAB263_04900, partial [Planctomycetota bacterium]
QRVRGEVCKAERRGKRFYATAVQWLDGGYPRFDAIASHLGALAVSMSNQSAHQGAEENQRNLSVDKLPSSGSVLSAGGYVGGRAVIN